MFYNSKSQVIELRELVFNSKKAWVRKDIEIGYGVLTELKYYDWRDLFRNTWIAWARVI